MKNRLKNWRSTAAVGIALLLVAGLSGIKPRGAQAKPPGYTFTPVAFLGDPAPGGGTFVNDFEPGGLNSHGDMAFGADVSTGGEGVFLRHKGQITDLGRTGGAAPGGGSFEFGFLGTVGLNDQGDMVFNFLLRDFTPPFGVNAGAYRYSHTTQTVTPVVVPFVTPVPGGGTFQGVFFQPTINNRDDVGSRASGPTRAYTMSLTTARHTLAWESVSSGRTPRGIFPAWSVREMRRPEVARSTMRSSRGSTTVATCPSSATLPAKSRWSRASHRKPTS